MAEVRKKIKNISEEAKKRKLARDRSRARTRVDLAKEFLHWRILKDQSGCKSDSLFAALLLNCYEKLTEASSAERLEPATSSPTFVPQQYQDEKPPAVTPGPLFGPLPDKCPSCGFALIQWCLQNGNTIIKEHQPKSIEVTVGMEQEDDPVSGAEQADEEIEASEEEEESEGSGVDEDSKGGEDSDEDWTPNQHYTQTPPKTKPTETAAGEEQSGEKGATEETEETGETGETEPRPGKRKLCIECGMFYKKRPHICEHKIKPFVCNICGKRCVSESTLKIHNRIHSESYEHPCKYCNANFKTRVDKLAHELIHQRMDDPYKCPDCAMTFPTFKERTTHMKTHGNQYKCPVCGIAFFRKTYFLRHVAVHTGEKPFKCPMCERGFNQEGHLKSHMRLHTGERPYSCKHCDKSFNHNVSLKSHMQRYHPMEQEDSSRETQETKLEREPPAFIRPKAKNKWPPTGRPKGRPKRNIPVKSDYFKTDDSGEESDSMVQAVTVHQDQLAV